MEIIITDLTRFKRSDIVCIAGINPETNECVRPLPYIATNDCRRLNILPGAKLEGNFVNRPCSAPHTEDKSYEGQLTFNGPCTTEEFKAILKATESPSVQAGFSVPIPFGQKYIPINTPPQKSIVTISVNPQQLSVVPDSFNPGKIKIIFTDNAGDEFRYLSITDLGFYNYAEKNTGDNFANLNTFIHSQSEVFIRVGLSREFEAPDGRNGFWLQANGIYLFPEYLEAIRCYS
ncbi:dual OB domain-containing protein [Thiovibrio sp. JS02]